MNEREGEQVQGSILFGMETIPQCCSLIRPSIWNSGDELTPKLGVSAFSMLPPPTCADTGIDITQTAHRNDRSVLEPCFCEGFLKR